MGRTRWRMHRLIAIVTLCAATASLAACTSDGPSADARVTTDQQVDGGFRADITKKLDAALDNAMKLSGASGAVAGVWAPWAGSWVVSPGTTTIDGGAPMSTAMHFRIGENTQAMTCSVLLQLADKGKVGLDDPATKYLKRLAGIDGITLRELCQNTAGLSDYSPAIPIQFVNNPTRLWAPLELVSDSLVNKRVGAPGKQYAASNSGYVLLGMVLEAATHKSWAELYQKYVFNRIGMTHTSYPSADTMTIPAAHPQGYAAQREDPSGKAVCTAMLDDTRLSPSVADVSGGVISTLTDMKAFVQALGAGSLVSDQSAEAQLKKTVSLGDDAPSWQKYGLGVMQYGPLLGHVGAIPGFLSVMLTEPKSGLAVVVMLNNSTDGAEFAKMLGLQLAAIVTTTPAKKGDTPVIALPWSVQQASDALGKLATCPPADKDKKKDSSK